VTSATQIERSCTYLVLPALCRVEVGREDSQDVNAVYFTLLHTHKYSAKMKSVLVVALMTVRMITATSPIDVVKVTSFRMPRKTKDGAGMCALDAANKTMSSSSSQDCSLACVRDDSCAGFNIKNPHTCALYNYLPKINILLPNCMFYQVAELI